MPDTLTPVQKVNLRRLYDLLADSSASAAAALGSSSTMPVGSALYKFRAINERVEDLHQRIREMLKQTD